MDIEEIDCASERLETSAKLRIFCIENTSCLFRTVWLAIFKVNFAYIRSS